MKAKFFSRVGLTIAATLVILNAFTIGNGQISAVKTSRGFLVVQNGVSKPFTIFVAGKNVKPQESKTPIFMVDGEILQLVVPTFEQIGVDVSKDSEEEVLRKHMVWESDYLALEVFTKKLNVVSEKVKVGDRTALFWGFERPAYNEENPADYFLTTVVGTRVISLSNPIPRNGTKESSKEFLIEVMKTLKVGDMDFDVAKISEQVRKGVEP